MNLLYHLLKAKTYYFYTYKVLFIPDSQEKLKMQMESKPRFYEHSVGVCVVWKPFSVILEVKYHILARYRISAA